MDSTPFSLPEMDAYRAYLTLLARGQIPTSMQARLDASDIVQETLLEAYRKRDQFRGGNDPKQLAGWLRKLLSCNLVDALRTQRRGQRDVRREQMLQQAVDESALGLENLLLAQDSTPSQRLENQFRAVQVAQAIEALPEHQRNALVLRYFQKASLEEIAVQLQKSKSAVAGLLKRGLANLREKMLEDDA